MEMIMRTESRMVSDELTPECVFVCEKVNVSKIS